MLSALFHSPLTTIHYPTSMKAKRHILDPGEKMKIQSVISAYLIKKYPQIQFAYLFGSFGKSASFSDIDLGIFCDPIVPDPLNFEIDLETQIENLIRYPVDVRILNGAPLSFVQDVIQNGRVIFDHKPDVRADFEGLVLKKYFDFSRFRRQYLAEVRNASL